MKRSFSNVYIEDFVEDLNYMKIVLYIGDVDPEMLRDRLKKDNMNHVDRLDSCLENKLMYVENCDLQDVDTKHEDEFGNSLLYLISEGYSIKHLKYDEKNKEYYFDLFI